MAGLLQGKTNGSGVIPLTYTCPDGSNRVPDSIIVTYRPNSDLPGKLYSPTIWTTPTATSAQIRYRRSDTNAWVGDGQGLDTYYLVIWNPQ